MRHQIIVPALLCVLSSNALAETILVFGANEDQEAAPLLRPGRCLSLDNTRLSDVVTDRTQAETSYLPVLERLSAFVKKNECSQPVSWIADIKHGWLWRVNRKENSTSLTRTSRNQTGLQGLCPWTPPGTRPRTPRSFAPK